MELMKKVDDETLHRLGELCTRAFDAADRLVDGFGKTGVREGVDQFKDFIVAWNHFRTLIDESGCSLAVSAQVPDEEEQQKVALA